LIELFRLFPQPRTEAFMARGRWRQCRTWPICDI